MENHGPTPTQQLKTTTASHLLIVGLVPHDLWRHEAIRAALACEPVPADPESEEDSERVSLQPILPVLEREREGDIDLLSKCILVFLILISFGFGRFSISDWFLIVCGPCVCTLSLL